MTTLYGITSCDTVKKARRWLDAHGVDYRYHDLRGEGLTRDDIVRWCREVDWDQLLNRRSTTWRGLSEEEKGVLNADQAISLMLVQPTLIKRPVLEHAGGVMVGFREADYLALFA